MNWTSKTKVLVQGITEELGLYYTEKMKAYGTNIVAGISPGKGGEKVDEIPVFDLIEQAISQVGEIDTSLIYVSPYQVLDAATEAIAAGIKEIIIVSTGVPPLDMVSLLKKAQSNKVKIIGPGSGGIIIPEKVLLGSIEPQFYTPGKIALVSLSVQLNYEVAIELKQAGLGEAIAVCLGNEKITASNFTQWLQILEKDEKTEVIVLIGQAEDLAEVAKYYVTKEHKKPIIAYIYGIYTTSKSMLKNSTTIVYNLLSFSLPIVNQVEEKIANLKEKGIIVVHKPSEISEVIKKIGKK